MTIPKKRMILDITQLREENTLLENRLRVVEAYLKDRLEYIEVLISDHAAEMGG